MRHGIEGYFDEITRFRRRLGGLMAGVSVASLLLLAVSGRELLRVLAEDTRRFGFEGPEQWVERIRLEQVANQDQAGLYELTYVVPQARKGGVQVRSDHVHAPPEPRTHRIGEGLDELDVAARARMMRLDAPVVRSEELVIERLIRPEYPEEARAHGVEGVVEMLALVDTAGAVVEVHIVGGTREATLERAATAAVLQCRYRPYRVHDVASRVWAAFRIAFTLY